MPKKNIHALLAAMIEAYDNGDADEDRRGFIAGWASTLTDAKNEPAEYEVLVTGDPFDGLSVEGPYPAGFLSDCEINGNTWWIVDLDEPTIKEV